MKKCMMFSFLLLIMHILLYGQEVDNNFKVDNAEIIWQKIYDTELTFKDFEEIIKDSGLLENIEIGENKITGDLKSIDADFRGAGYTEMVTPIYIARSHLSGFAILELKEGKYRVTLKRVVLTQKYNDPLTKQGERTNLEFYGLKNGKNELTNSFKKNPSYILDYTFSKLFDFNDSQKKDDW